MLLEKVAAGDPDAFAELYDATAARVYGLAQRIVANPVQADEVAHESYLEVWRTAQGFDPCRGSAMSWVLRIAHRAAINRIRCAPPPADREGTHQRLLRPTVLADADSDYDMADESSDAGTARQALAEPSRVQCQALELAYFDGHTVSEIAMRLGLSMGAATSAIRDGLIGLRDSVEDS